MTMLTDERVRAIFDLFDSDGSGYIDMDELDMCLQALGFPSTTPEVLNKLALTVINPEDLANASLASVTEKDGIKNMENDGEKQNLDPIVQELTFAEFRKFVETYAVPRSSDAERSVAYRIFRNFKDRHARRVALNDKEYQEEIANYKASPGGERQRSGEEEKDEEEAVEEDKIGEIYIKLEDFLAAAEDCGEFLPRYRYNFDAFMKRYNKLFTGSKTPEAAFPQSAAGAVEAYEKPSSPEVKVNPTPDPAAPVEGAAEGESKTEATEEGSVEAEKPAEGGEEGGEPQVGTSEEAPVEQPPVEKAEVAEEISEPQEPLEEDPEVAQKRMDVLKMAYTELLKFCREDESLKGNYTEKRAELTQDNIYLRQCINKSTRRAERVKMEANGTDEYPEEPPEEASPENSNEQTESKEGGSGEETAAVAEESTEKAAKDEKPVETSPSKNLSKKGPGFYESEWIEIHRIASSNKHLDALALVVEH